MVKGKTKALAKAKKKAKKKAEKKKAKVDEEERHYYVTLEDGNELPKWFDNGTNGLTFIKLPFSMIKKRENDRIWFHCCDKYVGKDDTYKFFLNEIELINIINDDGKFIVHLYVGTEVIKRLPNCRYLKKIVLSFEILCPIFQ